jgi:acetoin utilization protein AcuB
VSATLHDFMTRSPFTIGPSASLAAAHSIMRAHRIRHLPVVLGEELVGLLSESDLLTLEGVPGVDPSCVTVEEAMCDRPPTLSPHTSLEWVAADMAARRFESVVVLDDGDVVGVFTTIDALRALQALLAHTRRGSRVRARKTLRPVR